MLFKIQNLGWLCLAFTILADGLNAQPSDLVLRNAKLITMEPGNPQAQALAARGGKIVAIGTNQQMQAYIGPSTKVIDLGGRLAIPGFIEGHGHFMGLGSSKMILNLRDATNWDQIVAMVAAAAREAKPGTWILGRGWHQAKWDSPPSPNVDGFPIHDQLSKVSPHNPVWLEHASGHAGFANAEAMRLAGIDRNTPDPPGGQILKDPRGNPS
jgi:predicted amidohydrolase YtcJ